MIMKFLKNFFRMIPVLALVFVTLPVKAESSVLPDVVIERLNYGKKVSVEINNLKSEADISLVDELGKKLFETRVLANGTRAVKIFNLEQLPAGDYRFVVATQSKETLQPFVITDDEVQIRYDKRQVYLVPSIRVGNDYVDVSWLNSNISDLNVVINTPDGETVFEDDMANVLKVERRYNVSNLERGEYMVVVTTPYRTHYQRLNLN